MRRTGLHPAILLVGLFASIALTPPPLPAQQPPPYETRKLTDGVYIYRHMGHQAMFVVTPDGVVATDPINPTAAKVYLEEIRKVTPAPIRYVVYSHHHYDHISGGAPFKDAGAVFVAHRRAKETLERLKNPTVVIPDLVIEDRGVLTVGGARIELHYVGRNHTDNTLVVLLPKEKVLFAVDFLPIREVLFRNIPDAYYDEWIESIDRVLALDWDRMVAGHPRQGGVGTKEDVRNLKQYMVDLKEAVREPASQGKCFDQAMKEVKLPKYESWGRYNEFLPMNVERLCLYWRNGWQ
jgi:glyoxylase-like metal-dependent hydrolase (beta-lactamase superfamily II)